MANIENAPESSQKGTLLTSARSFVYQPNLVPHLLSAVVQLRFKQRSTDGLLCNTRQTVPMLTPTPYRVVLDGMYALSNVDPRGVGA